MENQAVYVNVGILKAPPPVATGAVHTVTHHSLESLAEKELPCPIVVHQTNYCEFDDILGDGQELEVYAHKVSPVVTLKAPERDYTVPVNSSFLFSVLYNPFDDLIKARKGYVFQTGADLINAVPQPCAVVISKDCTCSIFTNGSPSASGGVKKSIVLRKGEVLLIDSIASESHYGKVNRLLKCFTLKEKEVYLKENCEGHFSTQESSLTFSLTFILRHFKLPILSSPYERETGTIHSRFKGKCGMIHNDVIPLSSFIVSTPTTEEELDGSDFSGQLVEIYSTLKLDYHIATATNEELILLKQKMNKTCEELSPQSITAVLYNTKEVDTVQNDFLSPVNNNEWINEILSSPSLTGKDSKQVPKKKTPPVPPRPTNGTIMRTRLSSKKEKDTNESGKEMKQDGGTQKRLTPPPTKPKPSTLSRKPPLVSQNIYEPIIKYTTGQSAGNQSFLKTEQNDTIIKGTPTPLINQQPDKLQLLTDIAKELKTATDNVDSDDDDVHGYLVEDMYDNINYAIPPSPTSKEQTIAGPVTLPSVEPLIPAHNSQPSLGTTVHGSNDNKGYLEINKTVISLYNTAEVGDLLVAMGLSEYVSKFKEEMIDGQMLLELDDELLKEELGMNKKLHRLRLTMVIKGTQSVYGYIN
ncbi:PREDICTED: uncharacterized protein LOC109584380 isoform X2 [Amphimedon queenslandica]|uniref:SAM domain-containing protein n=1 Tax=Amphimedon queenslandica TaxID=400682 RepID=A0AAN0JFC3_AMPQE|nr:PREDICTED: uncharacterized protein LOC109584380 isoform X2 [Amphimedon queenslandica]|eukprot:XP_019855669.1 PREDICTED: uncharacterized protein LOC109584380 isoform X2 [Amphimedon queenslandica]